MHFKTSGKDPTTIRFYASFLNLSIDINILFIYVGLRIKFGSKLDCSLKLQLPLKKLT